MAAAFRKFRLLLWKNYLLQKRKKLVTFIEIALPTLFALILIFIRLRVESEPVNVNTTWDAFSVDRLPSDLLKTFINSIPRIAYTPDLPVTRRAMANAYTKLTGSNNSTDFIKGFPDESSLVEFVMFDNGTVNNTRDYLGGIVFLNDFRNNDQLPENIAYKIRLSFAPRNGEKKLGAFGSLRGWDTEVNYPTFQTIGPREKNSTIGGKPGYFREGFLALQHAVDWGIIQELNNTASTNNVSVNLQRFPYPAYVNDNFVLVIQQQLPLVLILSFVFCSLQIVKDVVHEKERKLKESMKMMGLPNWIHWTAWFIKYLLFLLISVIVMTVFYSLRLGDKHPPIIGSTAPTLMFVYLLLYAISTICFSFMISVFFKKANAAAAAGGIFFFISYIPYTFLQPRYDTLSMGVKIGTSLISNVAMSFGGQVIGMFEGSGTGVTWSNFAQGVSVDDNFTMAHVFAMLVADSILYILIALYFEAVFPGEYGIPQPWYFPVTKSYWCGTTQQLSDDETPLLRRTKSTSKVSSGFFEREPVGINAGIRIQNLRKEFGSGEAKNIAVNDMCLNMYEGQITALLGHNGAGKTTTMSMLTGFIPPTSGTAVVNGFDICRDIGAVRSSLGLCPQHDVLFDTLTVQEHLEFFAALKGYPPEKVFGEINYLLSSIGLEIKRNAQSKTLSGGMKRKLSVGIALIGDSKVVILDEPTSGMDPDARRHMWDILQNHREGRTMVLTTHFMDEADLLGDRIAIMAHGVVQCCGSSLFLKNKYGAGYHMVIVKSTNCNVNTITEIVTKHVPSARLESDVGAELSFILPNESSDKFEALFTELETGKDDLGISSFGASVTTMEEVFLRVGESSEITLRSNSTAEPDSDYGSTDGSEDGAPVSARSSNSKLGDLSSGSQRECGNGSDGKALIDSTNERNTGFALEAQQFVAMFMKRVLHTYRNKILTASQLVVPLFFTVMALIVLKTLPSFTDSPPLDLTLGVFKNPVVAYDNSPGLHPKMMADAYSEQYKDTGVKTVYLNDITNLNITEYILSEAVKDIAVFDRTNLIAATFRNSSDGKMDATALFNNQAYHTPGITVTAIDNALLKYYTNDTYSIATTNHPLPQTEEDKLAGNIVNQALGFTVAFNVVFGMSFLASSFVVFLVKERAIKAKHIQFVSGVHVFNFWLSTFVWDIINFLIPSILLIVSFAAFDIEAYVVDGHFLEVFVMFVLYAWAMLPFMYLLSFIFTVPSTALVWLTMFNILSGTATLLAVTILEIPQLDLLDLSKVLDWIFIVLLPNYCFGASIEDFYDTYETNKIYQEYCGKIDPATLKFLCSLEPNIPCCDTCTSNCLTYIGNYFSFEKGGMGRMATFMAVQGFLYFGLLFFFESQLLRRLWYKIINFQEDEPLLTRQTSVTVIEEDSDVLAERLRINGLMANPMVSLQTDTLVLQELSKYYGNNLAVNRLSLGIPHGECFGLLGINGAGKTTTFKMMTGDEIVSSGNAYLNGYDIRSHIKEARQSLGYCPQFDALIDQMTGRETLTMYARLRGVKEASIKKTVNQLLRALLLDEHADKMAKDYSGGNKRKLSAAIALCGDPPIIFLDEPTTGMDPVARRHLWNTLTKVRASGKTLVLTSHSMEECEALCTRLAIMVNGQFKCLGSTQHLKHKFGEGYTLLAKISHQENGAEGDLSPLRDFIERSFPGSILKDEHQGMVHYHITDCSLTWAKIFGMMERAKLTYNIEDYSVSQTTLEQVFINFARSQVPPEERRLGCCGKFTRCCHYCFCSCRCNLD